MVENADLEARVGGLEAALAGRADEAGAVSAAADERIRTVGRWRRQLDGRNRVAGLETAGCGGSGGGKGLRAKC